MSDPTPDRQGYEDRQDDLDRDQAIVDLSQAVTDREQFAGDVDQDRTDQRDGRLEDATGAGTIDAVGAARERTTLAAGQLRRDDQQWSMDDAQFGRDRHQTMLDTQQDELDDHAPGDLEDLGHERRFQAAEERARAAEARAEAALRRARAAEVRAAAVLARARAERDVETPPDAAT